MSPDRSGRPYLTSTDRSGRAPAASQSNRGPHASTSARNSRAPRRNSSASTCSLNWKTSAGSSQCHGRSSPRSSANKEPSAWRFRRTPSSAVPSSTVLVVPSAASSSHSARRIRSADVTDSVNPLYAPTSRPTSVIRTCRCTPTTRSVSDSIQDARSGWTWNSRRFFPRRRTPRW